MHKLWRGGATAPFTSTTFSKARQLHNNAPYKPLFFSFLSHRPPMSAIHLRSPAFTFTAAFGASLHCRRGLYCHGSAGGLKTKRAWSPLLRRQVPDSPPWSGVASNTRVFGTEAEAPLVEKGGIFEASDEHVGTQELEQQHLGGPGSSRLMERKQRSRSAVTARSQECDGPPIGNVDLLTIPGVGPRNLRKLVDKGFEGVAQLKQLYRDKFFGKSSEKMVDFLRTSVGIVHKNHAESITTFIKQTVDEELDGEKDTQNKASQKKRLTFCVEGNISVGKTTFLQRIANETLELRDLVEIVPEPVSKWQDVGPDHFNILDAFYNEPRRYAYTFQNYVFVTRVMQERESASGIKPLRLMERSIFSDRMVFVRAVHEANWMNEMEISIYDSWFDPVVSSLPGLIPDGFIYLRASPDTCHKRMMVRKRAEEGGVTLDYLRDLHEKHESWLFPFQSGNHGVLSVAQLPMHMDSSLHPDIRDRVFYLEGNNLHSCIQKVPALVLDCEPNVDFNKDIESKRRYARQVAEFFEFVKRKQADTFSGPRTDEQKRCQQIILPHEGHLWMPNDTVVPSSTRDIQTAMPLSG